MAKVLIETYGCTLNQADSEIMESVLSRDGHDVVMGRYDDSVTYDYVIVNTCTVKNPTEQKILDRLTGMNKLGSRLIVTGCMASANSDKISSRVHNPSIVTTANVHRIADAVNDIATGKRAVYDSYARTDKAFYLNPTDSVIAKIPVSEGCLSSCSFCETKFARGPLNSFSENLILKAIETAVRNGAREIELTSQDMGAYGLDRKTNIAELVSAALDIEGSFKIRIGMLNPEHLPRYIDRLIDVYRSANVYKFIHLPVQSGSNKVLQDMNRGYSAEEFRLMTKELRRRVDDISIATDMIVGFPTETEDDFAESMRLISETGLSRINISKFGARPHAKASRMKQLRNEVIKDRSTRMYRLARQVETEALTKVLGKRRRVLLTEIKGASMLARDDSYREIAVSGSDLKLGESMDVDIYDNTSVCLLARPAEIAMLNR